MKQESPSTRIRLFENAFLEKFTLGTPAALAVTWALVLVCAVWASWGAVNWPAAIGLGAAGLVLWTLFEYAMHRFVFHLKLDTPAGRAFMFLAHGNHHAQPEDPLRNIMPPIVSLAINGTVWLVLWLVFGAAGSAIFVGFGIGYVIYDFVHYACHQLPMRHPVLRRLRQHHIRHHYGKQDGNYAITAIFWDRLLGTDIPKKSG